MESRACSQVVCVRCLVCDGQGREEKAGEEDAVKRSDSGNLGKASRIKRFREAQIPRRLWRLICGFCRCIVVILDQFVGVVKPFQKSIAFVICESPI